MLEDSHRPRCASGLSSDIKHKVAGVSKYPGWRLMIASFRPLAIDTGVKSQLRHQYLSSSGLAAFMLVHWLPRSTRTTD